MFYVLGVAQHIHISKCCFHFVIGITMNVCTYFKSTFFFCRCGEIPINSIFQQFLPKVILKKLISEPDMYKSVILARNDFLSQKQ